MRISGILAVAGIAVGIGIGIRAVAGGGNDAVTNLYVSPSGNDSWSGMLSAPNSAHTDGPKATITGARDALRILLQKHQVAAGGAYVNILPGTYALTQSFQLQAADSGSAGAPVVYRALQPGTVEIMGGKDLKTWGAISDPSVKQRLAASVRSHVLEANLTAAGISDVGTRQVVGFYQTRVPSISELFYEGHPMTVAQSPNTGWTRLSKGPVPAGMSFTYSGSRPSSWSSENDVWVHGFFFYDWADYYERVSAWNPAQQAARTQGTPSYGYQPGARFVYVNILEELDTPGEYYLDLKRGKVYFYPPVQESDGRTVISTLTTPLIRLDKVSNVQFSGLALRYSRGDAMFINGCDSIAVNGCIVSNMGLHGIETSNVTNTTIQSCDISNIGSSGIILDGGNRTSLTSGGNSIVNCHIALTGRIVMTSEAAIELTGVGAVVKNNSIHDVPQDAIRVWGNNHQITGNEIYRACLQSSDAGAVYIGRNFTEQGNVFQGNYFHDILANVQPNPMPNNGNTYQINSVYLDDFASGTTVVGNVFQSVDVGVLIGGGRDNTVQNNAFLDCDYGLAVDARGLDWASASITNPNSDLMLALTSSSYQSSVWRQAYPNLANILNDNPATPKRNKVENNVSYVGPWMNVNKDYPTSLNPVTSNCVGVDPGFVDMPDLNLTPKAGSASAQAGFQPVNGKAAGLKLDSYRTSLPSTGQFPAP